jgi:magnesium transporter
MQPDATPTSPTDPLDDRRPVDTIDADRRPGDPGVRLRAVAWSAGVLRELTTNDQIAAALAEPSTRLWVDAAAPTHAQIASVSTILGLHPLVVEDIAERNQRAKLEEVDGDLHVVLFALAYDGTVRETEIDIVLGARTLLTVHEPGWDPFSLPQLRAGPSHLMAKGVDFLLYGLVDGIVDRYFPVLDALGDEIDGLQDDVIRQASPATLEHLFALKRELIALRRAMSPAREIFNQLTNRDLALVAPEHVVYFRDVYDHLIRITDELDNDRELVAGTLEVYLSTINNNLSAIMKRLTGVTVILAGAALGAREAGGFWIVTIMVVVLAALTALVLRRIDWV